MNSCISLLWYILVWYLFKLELFVNRVKRFKLRGLNLRYMYPHFSKCHEYLPITLYYIMGTLRFILKRVLNQTANETHLVHCYSTLTCSVSVPRPSVWRAVPWCTWRPWEPSAAMFTTWTWRSPRNRGLSGRPGSTRRLSHISGRSIHSGPHVGNFFLHCT